MISTYIYCNIFAVAQCALQYVQGKGNVLLKCNFSDKKATEETKRPKQRNSKAENAQMKL